MQDTDEITFPSEAASVYVCHLSFQSVCKYKRLRIIPEYHEVASMAVVVSNVSGHPEEYLYLKI